MVKITDLKYVSEILKAKSGIDVLKIVIDMLQSFSMRIENLEDKVSLLTDFMNDNLSSVSDD